MKTRMLFWLGIACCVMAAWIGIPDRSCAQTTETITGEVRDAAGPIANAVVRVRATDMATTTDAAGLSWLPHTSVRNQAKKLS